MLVKLTDFPDDLAETLCHITGQRTASKAVMQTISDWQRLTVFEADANLRMSFMTLEIERLRFIVEGARSSAALLLDSVSGGPADEKN